MFKVKNPFKKRKDQKPPTKTNVGVGELLWKSINLENEPNLDIPGHKPTKMTPSVIERVRVI